MQDVASLGKELGEVQERLIEREEEISELKAERNNTRVRGTVSDYPSSPSLN